MERSRLVLAVAALLTVAALGFTAAAVDNGGTGENSGGTDTSGATTSEGSASTALASALVIAIIAVAVGGVAYSVYRDSMPWWLTVTLVVAVVVLLVLVGLGYVLDPAQSENSTTEERTPSQTETPEETTDEGGSDDGDEGGGLSATSTLAVLGLLLLAGAVAVARFTQGGTPPDDESEEGDDATAVGEAAGRAADELEETTLSNAIFRAWREMTDALDVESPETTTPAEFEEQAVAAGIDRADVSTLTTLFREVRYGDAPATPEREDRAWEALRGIEDAYAQESDDSEPGDDSETDQRRDDSRGDE
jgi:Spy/CpxP family protein refolding chaperone